MEGTASQVKIPPDSVSATAHNVRTVIPTNPNLASQSADGLGTLVPTVEEQQVVTIADDDGDIATVADGQLCTTDQTTQDLLKAVCIRLDMLNDAMIKHYEPPDNLWMEG